MRLRNRRKKKGAGLMLTSLLDMFTIILIFLIVSFEAEDYEFKLNPDLTLPESSAKSAFKPAVNVAITSTGIFIQSEKVAPLFNGQPRPEDLANEQVPEVVDALQRILAFRQDAVDEPEDATVVMLQADKGLEYRTIYLVMRSAREAGFDKYRLTVMKK